MSKNLIRTTTEQKSFGLLKHTQCYLLTTKCSNGIATHTLSWYFQAVHMLKTAQTEVCFRIDTLPETQQDSLQHTFSILQVCCGSAVLQIIAGVEFVTSKTGGDKLNPSNDLQDRLRFEAPLDGRKQVASHCRQVHQLWHRR